MNGRRLGALVVALAVWAFGSEPAKAQAAPASAQAAPAEATRKITRGPFVVGTPPRSITVEITTKPPASPEGGYRDSFVVRDRKGQELMRRDAKLENAWDANVDLSVAPGVVPLPGGASALLVTTDRSPSAPGTGFFGQLFGFSSKGALVPITGIIAPYGSDGEASSFRVTRLMVHGVSRLVVEVEESTGNFIVIRHYPIDPEGVRDDLATPLQESRYGVRIDPREAARVREDSELDPVVTLRSAPQRDAFGKSYVLEGDETIEFLDAALDEDQWFIHVRIDGREGYVSNLDGARDLDCLGLASSG
jgi:hypothetical protein